MVILDTYVQFEEKLILNKIKYGVTTNTRGFLKTFVFQGNVVV